MSEEAGHDALTRLFQGEMIKHFTINNQLFSEIKTVLQQNQVLLLQMDRNIEKLKSNSY
jgi:methylase of polypeptide subunit release factors